MARSRWRSASAERTPRRPAGPPVPRRPAPGAGPVPRTSGGPGSPPRCRRRRAGPGRRPGLAVRGVQPYPFAWQHVVIDRVAGQLVPERVPATGPVHHEQVVLDRFAQRRVQLRLGHPGHRLQQSLLDPGAGRGRGAQHPLGRLGHRLGAGQQHVAQRRRQVARVGAAVDRGQDLLDQERVALRAFEHHIGERGGRGRCRGSRATGQRPRPRLNRCSSMCSTLRTRSQAVISGRSGWRRCSSSERYVSSSSTPSSRSVCTRNTTRSRVDRSAQCRSSTTSSSGRCAASRVIRPSTCSSSCVAEPSGAGPPATVGSSSGSSRANSRRAGPSSRPVPRRVPSGRVCAARRPVARARCPRRRAARSHRAAPVPRAERLPGHLFDQPGLADAGLAAQQHDCGLAAHRPIKESMQPAKFVAAANEDGADQIVAHDEQGMSMPTASGYLRLPDGPLRYRRPRRSPG